MDVVTSRIPRKRGGAVTFHRIDGCRTIDQMIRPVQVDIRTIAHPDPCRRCYPDAPVLPKLLKRRCVICSDGKVFPCKHNGGVKVKIPTGHSHIGHRIGYVWPENAYRYEAYK